MRMFPAGNDHTAYPSTKARAEEYGTTTASSTSSPTFTSMDGRIKASSQPEHHTTAPFHLQILARGDQPMGQNNGLLGLQKQNRKGPPSQGLKVSQFVDHCW